MASRSARHRYCRCGTQLAADNSGRQCAPCERASRDKLIAPPEVPAEFWQTEQFRDAFAAQHIGWIARAYRTHYYYHHAAYGPGGISQDLLGQWLGLAQPQVSRIETGAPVRDLDTLTYWVRVLRIPAELLWFRLPGETRELVVAEPAADPQTLAPLNAGIAERSTFGFLLNEPATGGHASGRDAATATGCDTVNPLSCRSLLIHGLTVVTLPASGLNNAASAITSASISPAADSSSFRLMLSQPPTTSWAAAIYDTVLNPTDAARRAVLEWDADPDGKSDDICGIRRSVDTATWASLSADYAELARLLPRLIGQVEAVSMQARESDQLAVLRLLSDVYSVAGWTLIKADSPDGAWIAAERAVQVAERADDVIRVAAATRCLAEVHMRAGNLQQATRTALLAAVHLDTAPAANRRTTLCLRGAALLSASAAAARRGDSREAHAALKAASACAIQLNEDCIDLGTVFGPTNVAIHRVAVAVELGDAREAARHVPTVNLGQMPKALTERRARFLIDVARSHMGLKDYTAALDALLQAERIAPDELHQHRLTHEVVPQLLSHGQCTADQADLRALADRCSLLH